MATIVIRPDFIELHDSGGAPVLRLDYDGTANQAVAALTTVFGAAPETAPDDGWSHGPAAMDYIWPGFEVRDYLPAEGKFPEFPDFSVWGTAAVAGDVALTTAPGYGVGSSMSGAFQGLGRALPHHYHVMVEYGSELGDRAIGHGEPNARTVVLIGDGNSDPATEIGAPMNLGKPGP